MKKIGILGSGIVARTLGNGFLKYGYKVMLGTRDKNKLKEWQEKSGGAVGTFSETALFGDIIVLAVKGTVAAAAIQEAGIKNLDGKTIIDTTNPIADLPPVNGVLQYFTKMDESLMEILQKLAPGSHFVKAFNSVGNAYMVDPDFKGQKPTMFICGNRLESKAQVTDILTRFGWETEDVGSVESARAIEPLCILWCIPGFMRSQWNHAFKLLKA
ncbi:MAG: NADPH-dependent F420 reductase [Flavobacteriales bacterium]